MSNLSEEVIEKLKALRDFVETEENMTVEEFDATIEDLRDNQGIDIAQALKEELGYDLGFDSAEEDSSES